MEATRTADARARRLARIVNSAHVRAALGQSAVYALADDGRHVVMLRGGEVFIGKTLDEAVRAAHEATR